MEKNGTWKKQEECQSGGTEREKVIAKSDATRIAESGTRTSEAEAKGVHSEGNGGVCQKRSRRKISSVNEEVSRNQESKESEGITSVEDNQDLGMEGEFAC